MQPLQSSKKLSLNKSVVTVLSQMNNNNGKNDTTPGFMVRTSADCPPDTVSCTGCITTLADGCGTGTGIFTL